MRIHSFFLSLLAALIFLAGVALQISLSGSLVWAEMEASIYGTQLGAAGLSLSCPIMLAPSESGTISASVTNTTDQDTLPVVTAQISHGKGTQNLRQTLSLSPNQTQTMNWTVNASDIVFSNLIIVNVVQSRYSELDPHQGFCGILIFSLFNLTGNKTLALIFISGITLMLIGGAFWWRLHMPFDDPAEQIIKACGGLAAVTTLALLTALPRWWGLALFLDAFALIMLSVILTEFVLFPKHRRK